MIVQRLPIDCDMNETTLLECARVLDVPVHELKLYAPRRDRELARKLSALRGLRIAIIPDALLLEDSGRLRWGVEHQRGVVWTVSI